MTAEKPTQSGWRVAAGLLLILALGAAAFFGLRALWSLFSDLEKEVAAAFIVAFGTISVSVVTVLASRYFERTREIEQQQRDKKVPMYEEFISFWFRFLFAGGQGSTQKKPTEIETIDFFRSFTEKLLVWGSDDVVVRWSRFRRQIAAGGATAVSIQAMLEFEQLLLAMRREFGHRNKRIGPGDVLGLFVNDIDQYVP